jgi:hypothetical protein
LRVVAGGAAGAAGAGVSAGAAPDPLDPARLLNAASSLMPSAHRLLARTAADGGAPAAPGAAAGGEAPALSAAAALAGSNVLPLSAVPVAGGGGGGPGSGFSAAMRPILHLPRECPGAWGERARACPSGGRSARVTLLGREPGGGCLALRAVRSQGP